MESWITVNDKLTTQSILDIVVSKRLTLRWSGEMAGSAFLNKIALICHGDDARGNEGPDLYNLTMSDARIAKPY